MRCLRIETPTECDRKLLVVKCTEDLGWRTRLLTGWEALSPRPPVFPVFGESGVMAAKLTTNVSRYNRDSYGDSDVQWKPATFTTLPFGR